MTNKIIPENSVTIPMQMRWGDMDAYHHANNAVYLKYVEEARFRWRDGIVGDGFDEAFKDLLPENTAIVAAGHKIDYVAQMQYGDVKGQIHVHFWNTRLGNSSVTSATVITDTSDETVYAKVLTTLVQFNQETNKPEPLTEPMKEYLQKFMGKEPEFHS
ncbi:MAG: thioesterase family protein [Micrococcaceae bacterium]